MKPTNNITSEVLAKEVYEIEHEGKKIFYAPLTRNFDVTLEEDGEIDNEWYEKAIDMTEVPDFIHEKSFSSLLKKVKIRLNVTNKCSLNCEYCSVAANKGGGIDMSEEIAFSSIDNLFEFAEKNNASEIELTFSGGEPTLKFDMIEKIIQYIDEKAEKSGIEIITKLLTNGLVPKNKIPLIGSLFNGVQISWDGFLDYNPRFPQKSHIHEKIWENIGLFVKSGTRVNILTVISEYNLNDIEKVVDELYKIHGIEDIVLSVKDGVGKAKNNVLLDYETLRKNYMHVWKKYRGYDIDIPLTGVDIHSLSNHPCGISVPNFSIGPKGDISACTLSFNEDENTKYDIGKIVNDKMILEQNNITKLQAINILSMEECSKCFAKWHCRGGCRYANEEKWLGEIQPSRCNMIRNILADKILYFSGIE